MPKQPKQSQLELEVPVFRNADEWSGGAERLADLHAVHDGLVEDLRQEVRKRKKEIRARWLEISNLAKGLREGRGNRDQKPLFQRDAERALTDVHVTPEPGTVGAAVQDAITDARAIDDQVAELSNGKAHARRRASGPLGRKRGAKGRGREARA